MHIYNVFFTTSIYKTLFNQLQPRDLNIKYHYASITTSITHEKFFTYTLFKV